MKTFAKLLPLSRLPWLVEEKTLEQEAEVQSTLKEMVMPADYANLESLFESTGNLSKSAGNFLIPRVMRIRMVDIRLWKNREVAEDVRQGIVAPRTVDIIARFKLAGLKAWPKLFVDRNLVEPSPSPDSTGLSPLQSTYLCLQYHLRISRDYKSIINCEIAALHLAWLLEGKESFGEGEDQNTLVKNPLNDTPHKTDSDLSDCLEQAGHDPRGFHLPLQAAALISPIVLFLNVDFTKRSVSKQDILMAWLQFSRDRPTALSKVEQILWTAIFDIAQGRLSFEVIREALERINPILNELSELDCTWFTQNPTGSSPSSRAITVVGEGEGPIGTSPSRLMITPGEEHERGRVEQEKSKQIPDNHDPMIEEPSTNRIRDEMRDEKIVEKMVGDIDEDRSFRREDKAGTDDDMEDGMGDGMRDEMEVETAEGNPEDEGPDDRSTTARNKQTEPQAMDVDSEGGMDEIPDRESREGKNTQRDDVQPMHQDGNQNAKARATHPNDQTDGEKLSTTDNHDHDDEQDGDGGGESVPGNRGRRGSGEEEEPQEEEEEEPQEEEEEEPQEEEEEEPQEEEDEPQEEEDEPQEEEEEGGKGKGGEERRKSQRLKRSRSVSGGVIASEAQRGKRARQTPKVKPRSRPIKSVKTRTATPQVEEDDVKIMDFMEHIKEPVKRFVYPTVIDLTMDEETKFTNADLLDIGPVFSDQRFLGTKTYTIPRSDGKTITFSTFAHNERDKKWMESVLDQVPGKALWETSPEFSQFKILSREEASRLDNTTGQAMIAAQQVVITAHSGPEAKFDELALSDLGFMDQPRQIHDLSSPTLTSTGDEALRKGTFNDLLDSFRHNRGKILNALDIPLTTIPPLEGAFDTHNRAFHLARSVRLLDITTGNLTEGMAWALAATSGAYFRWHIDTDGFGTYFDVITGVKIWIVAKPPGPSSNSDLYGSKDFGTSVVQPQSTIPLGWIVEAIALRANESLRMQPCTPHAVITPTAAICKGGHFYATSTIRRTCYGIYHCLTAGRYITNTDHVNTSRSFIQRIITLYHSIFTRYFLHQPEKAPLDIAHVPDITKWDGMLDLWMVINLTELLEITHPRAYSTGFTALKRDQMITARKYARELRNWTWHNFKLQDMLGNDVDQKKVYWDFLAHQCRALVRFKEAAQRKGIQGQGDYTRRQLEDKIVSTFHGNTSFGNAWENVKSRPIDNLCYPGEPLSIVLETPTDQDLCTETGMTALDVEWKREPDM